MNEEKGATAMATFKTRVTTGREFCALEVTTPEGLCLEYRYGSQAQARYMAAVFELGPSSFPDPFRTYFRSQKKRGRRGQKARQAAAEYELFVEPALGT